MVSSIGALWGESGSSEFRRIGSMSTIMPASQYEQDYLPHRLRNWEVPSEAELRCAAARGGSSSPAGVRPHSGRTQFIVDQRGYLIGAKRAKSAFNLQPEERLKSAPRWPQNNLTVKVASAATMGYKGQPLLYGKPLPQ